MSWSSWTQRRGESYGMCRCSRTIQKPRIRTRLHWHSRTRRESPNQLHRLVFFAGRLSNLLRKRQRRHQSLLYSARLQSRRSVFLCTAASQPRDAIAEPAQIVVQDELTTRGRPAGESRCETPVPASQDLPRPRNRGAGGGLDAPSRFCHLALDI